MKQKGFAGCLMGGLAFFLGGCQLVGTYRYRGEVTSHFNGKKFVNEDPITDRGFTDFLKWRFNSQKVPWPKWIPNKEHHPPPKRVLSDSVSYTFINHATVLIQTSGQNILTDPIFSMYSSPVSFAGPKRVRAPGLPMEALPPIDVVLISHNHYDHLDLKSLTELRDRDDPEILVGLGVNDLLIDRGFKKVTAFDWWQTKTIGSVNYTFTPTRHFSGRGLFDRMQTLWGAFLIKTVEKNIYFGGDTGYGKHFKAVAQKFGPIDLAFLPIGAYEPRWFMKDVHLNPEEAVLAHIDLKSRRSVGIHFGTFDNLTDEGIDEPGKELKRQLQKNSIPETAFIAPDFGQSYQL